MAIWYSGVVGPGLMASGVTGLTHSGGVERRSGSRARVRRGEASTVRAAVRAGVRRGVRGGAMPETGPVVCPPLVLLFMGQKILGGCWVAWGFSWVGGWGDRCVAGCFRAE
mgnify:CR=1 FL=1